MQTDLDKYAFGFMRYRPPMSVVDWANQEVELSMRVTEQAGPYSTRLHPYVDEILETVRDPNIKRVSLCWGSQTAKTTSFYVMLGYSIDQRPQPILWVFPNVQLCRAFASDRWLPFCQESRGISQHIPRYIDGGIDRDHFTIMKQEFTRCTMNLVGAGSSANVRSYPISLLVLDEIDVIPEATRRECMERVKGRQDYKILQSSTPVMEHGGIWQEFQESDRRRYHVPCPNCAKMIVFNWDDGEGNLSLSWDESAKNEDGSYDLSMVQKTAVYICQKCGDPIRDVDKIKMLRRGKWVVGNRHAEEGSRSYHLNSFYSPMITFGRMAVEFLKAQQTHDGMRAFVQGWLAEPWMPETHGMVDPDAFKNLEGGYERGEIRGDYRLIGVDVQQDHFVWVVRGFDKDGHSYLIDNGLVPSFTDLQEICGKYEVSKGIVDTGYRTQEMYEEIHNRRPFWFGAKGWAKMPKSYRISQLDPFHQHESKPSGKRIIHLLHVNKDVWGQELLKKRAGVAGNWQIYDGVDKEYVRQMLSTNLVENVDKLGKATLDWTVEGHKQDHYWDCENYIMAFGHVFGLGGAAMESSQEPARQTPRKKFRSGGGKSFWG